MSDLDQSKSAGTTEVKPDVSSTGRRWIIVSLPKHTIDVLEDGKVVHRINEFSTGRAGHLTPLVENALIDPNRRYRQHRSTLYNDKSGRGAEMPFAMFFEGACAFHAGDPDAESHGCIHLASVDAEWLFNWVGKNEVHVRVQGPKPPTPALRTA